MRRALPMLLLATCAVRLPPLGDVEGTRPRGLRHVPPEALGETVSLAVQENPRDRRWVHGELLACDAETLYVLLHVTREAIYLRLSWGVVRQVRVGDVPVNALLPVWTTLGALSSLSHGYYAGLSMPVWLGAGIPFSIDGNDARPRMSNCEELRASARFPQGLPASFREAHFTPSTAARATRDASVGAMVAPWATPDAAAAEDVTPPDDARAEDVAPDDAPPEGDAGAPADA